VNVLGQPPLDPLELLGVEAELHDVQRLRRAGELRVHRLVAGSTHRSEACLALVDLHPDEKIGEPAPRAVREVGLVDDVRVAGADRVLGGTSSLLLVEALVVVGEHAHDAEAGRFEPREMCSLVLVPLAHDDLPVRIDDPRALELPAHDAELELRQVRAREVIREVGGREPKRAVRRKTHRPEYQPTTEPCLRGSHRDGGGGDQARA
jgi:hypothetical protein